MKHLPPSPFPIPRQSLAAAIFALSLTGCGAGNFFDTGASGGGGSTGGYAGAPISAIVSSGATPIAGSSVQLLAVGTTGNGSAATSLMSAALTSGPAGTISIPAYNCPASSSLLYLVSRGGTAGNATSANSNIALMAALGPCGNVVSGSKFVVNEATTVAAAYALAPFYGAGGSIGAAATNLTGITNAFQTAATLANPVTGTSPGAALPANGRQPCPTHQLARQHPQRVCRLCLRVPRFLRRHLEIRDAVEYARRPHQPRAQSDQRRRCSLHSVHRQQGLHPCSRHRSRGLVSLPHPLRWRHEQPVRPRPRFSRQRLGRQLLQCGLQVQQCRSPAFASGVTGYGLYNSYGLAVDLKDNAWIPNEQPYQSVGTIGSVTELAPAGSALSGAAGYVAGGLNYPLSVAIDPNGTVWVVDFGNSHVTLLNSSGAPISGASGYTTPLFAFPVVVAIDANHFGWIGNQSSNAITRVSPDGSSFVNYACCNGASGIAIDQGNNVWAANFYGDSVSLISSTGAIVSAGNYTGNGSILRPQGIAIDGAGNVWIANYRTPYLTELSGTNSGAPGTSLTPSTGVGADAGLLEAYAAAVDASGNIWVTNQGNSTLTKFIGMATPVKTPLSGLPTAP